MGATTSVANGPGIWVNPTSTSSCDAFVVSSARYTGLSSSHQHLMNPCILKVSWQHLKQIRKTCCQTRRNRPTSLPFTKELSTSHCDPTKQPSIFVGTSENMFAIAWTWGSRSMMPKMNSTARSRGSEVCVIVKSREKDQTANLQLNKDMLGWFVGIAMLRYGYLRFPLSFIIRVAQVAKYTPYTSLYKIWQNGLLPTFWALKCWMCFLIEWRTHHRIHAIGIEEITFLVRRF